MTSGQRPIAACGAMRYVPAMRVRHKGLRALHERDDPAAYPPVWCPGSAVSCSGCKRRRIRAARTRPASGCIR